MNWINKLIGRKSGQETEKMEIVLKNDNDEIEQVWEITQDLTVCQTPECQNKEPSLTLRIIQGREVARVVCGLCRTHRDIPAKRIQ